MERLDPNERRKALASAHVALLYSNCVSPRSIAASYSDSADVIDGALPKARSHSKAMVTNRARSSCIGV
jgi:hypothetical protein